MDITRADFPREILKILEEVSESHFVAFDFEFSGVAGYRSHGGQKTSLQEYYDDVKAAAEKYQILQAGFTIVKQDRKKSRYVARPYNFNLSPLPGLRERHFGREWSYHSGAVSFLARNGFNFDEPVRSGVQYLSRSEEHLVRQKMVSEEQSRGKIGDMELKPDDDALVQHIRSELQNWQAQAKEEQDEFVNIPSDGSRGSRGVPLKLNRYQVRLTHQIVRNEYPGLKTVGMGHFVQVTNPTAEQQAEQAVAVAETRENEIGRAIGLRWLIEGLAGGSILDMPAEWVVAGLSTVKLDGLSPREYLHRLQERLRRRRRILVGHNCLTDLVNLYKCFFGPLPECVDDFAAAIHDLFPGVIDTKVLASFGVSSWANTSLEDVEMELRRQESPRIHVPAEYDRYAHSSRYHEAGYDSLLTATVAIKLSAKLEREHGYVHVLDGAGGGGGGGGGGGSAAAFGHEQDKFYDARARAEDERDLDVDVPVAPAAATAASPAASTTSSSPEIGALDAGPARSELGHGHHGHHQTAQVKSRLATTNIYDVLSTDDALQLDEAPKQAGRPGRDAAVARRKQAGMPDWDNNSSFWAVFGNKLQVNGCREGICKLE